MLEYGEYTPGIRGWRKARRTGPVDDWARPLDLDFTRAPTCTDALGTFVTCGYSV